MAKKLLTWLVLFMIVAGWAEGARASAGVPVAGASAQLRVDTETVDHRVTKLRQYLRQKHSPLTPYAAQIVREADNNQLDWRLLVSIAGVESGFGQHIPWQSSNAWGWNNGSTKFSSWPESISVVSRGLKIHYMNKGLTTPEKMSRVYAPPSQTWGGKVRYFLSEIELNKIAAVTGLDVKWN